MQTPSTYRGFTLLEVLIALLIFSLGLLGMAGLMVISVRTNHSAYLRTQASFLAQSMGDRMRANMQGVWSGGYDGSYPATGSDPCAGGIACSRAQIAARDKVQWSQQLVDLLPASTGTIACTPDGTVSIDGVDQANGAPFTGTCTIILSWNESRVEQSTDSPLTQTFTWSFQP